MRAVDRVQVKEWMEGLEEHLSVKRVHRVRVALEGAVEGAVRLAEAGHPAGSEALHMAAQLHAPVHVVRASHCRIDR